MTLSAPPLLLSEAGENNQGASFDDWMIGLGGNDTLSGGDLSGGDRADVPDGDDGDHTRECDAGGDGGVSCGITPLPANHVPDQVGREVPDGGKGKTRSKG